LNFTAATSVSRPAVGSVLFHHWPSRYVMKNFKYSVADINRFDRDLIDYIDAFAPDDVFRSS
jgi:hypothetical protein